MALLSQSDPPSIRLTRFRAHDLPDKKGALTKQFSLAPDGSITKSGQPNFIKGTAERIALSSLSELPDVLDGLDSSECIATGVFDDETCAIVPKGASTTDAEGRPTRHRTKDAMSQPSPGLVLFDYDVDELMPATFKCESPQALFEKLSAAIPPLAGVGYVGAGSCSSGVYSPDTGETYRGGGFHLYIVYAGGDLAVLKEYLEVKLWCAGLGYISLARNGARLKRTILDLSVLSPERLIYEAAPMLLEGLARNPREWSQQAGAALGSDLSITENERKACAEAIAQAMSQPEIMRLSDERYVTHRKAKIAALVELKNISEKEAEERIPHLFGDERESRSLILSLDDVVEFRGEHITVSELLDNGRDYDGASMPDPVEGRAYGNTTAIFYFNGGRKPCICSLAHGQKTIYKLPSRSVSGRTDLSAISFDINSPEAIDPESFPHVHYASNGAPKVLPTLQNCAHLLKAYGVAVQYNVISKKLDIIVPGAVGSPDNALNVAMSKILSLAALNRMSTSSLPGYVNTLGDANLINPVAEWILSTAWDGIDRIPQIMATLQTAQDYPEQLKRGIIYRWLLSAVAGVLTPTGFTARGVLTLQGPQGIGKTSWIRALVTIAHLRDTTVLLGHHLDAGNKDSIITAISHWIVELGELDSSFRKDVARLKSFITGSSDKVRRPYAMADSEYQRRTVFCATVNDPNFLVDSTGNTRWWTLPVTEINFNHDIDMQQLYAQLAIDLENGAEWWLDPEEEKLLAEQNRQHKSVNVIEEKLMAEFDLEIPADRRPYMSAIEVLRRIGYDKPSNPQCRECGSVLREHYGAPKKINGIMKWRVPLHEDAFAQKLKPPKTGA